MDRPSRMKEIVSYAVDSSDNSDDDLLDSDMEEAAEVTTSRLRLKNLKNNGSSTDIDRNMELSPCHGELGIEEKDGLDVVAIAFLHHMYQHNLIIYSAILCHGR